MSEEGNTPDSGTAPVFETRHDVAGFLGKLGSEEAEAPVEAPEEDNELPLSVEADGDDGSPEEGEPEAEAEATKTETRTDPVKIPIKLSDGTTVEVTPDELVKGYQRQSDYTRKTQQIAEAERGWKDAAAKLNETLQRIEQVFPQEQEPDWTTKAREMDPWEFQAEKAQWEQRQKALTQAREQAQEAAKAQAAEVEQKRKEWRQQQVQAVKSDPLFADIANDPEKATARQRELHQTALDLGFSTEDFETVEHAGVYRMLEWARRGMAVHKQAQEIQAQAKSAPKERRPGTSPARAKGQDQAVAQSFKALRNDPNDRRAAARLFESL